MHAGSAPAICALTPADIPFGMELKSIAGWNQLPADWARLLAWEPSGCFLASSEGAPAGTATTINYENRFGWVGMVLVHPDMRRMGIGTALLLACIEYLEQSGVRAVKLDATPMGKPLYETLGFVDEYLLERHVAVADSSMGGGCHDVCHGPRRCTIEPLAAAHLDAVCALDLAAFGADRSRVLRLLRADPQADCLVAQDGGEVTGYLFTRPGTNARYLGPWVAREAEAAEALLRQALARHAGEKVYVDISLAHPAPAAVLAGLGFEKQRILIRMFRGSNDHPGDTSLVYGVAGPEIG